MTFTERLAAGIQWDNARAITNTTLAGHPTFVLTPFGNALPARGCHCTGCVIAVQAGLRTAEDVRREQQQAATERDYANTNDWIGV